jgi:hypothetical protein
MEQTLEGLFQSIKNTIYPNTIEVELHFDTQEEFDVLYKQVAKEGGQCVGYSFNNYLLQKKNERNAIRCRGYCYTKKSNLINQININNNEEYVKHIHYWVEVDSYVIDKQIFRTLKIPKRDFYDYSKISNVEIADNGIFHDNNYILKCGPDNLVYLNKYVIDGIILQYA